jgi:predicted ATPase
MEQAVQRGYELMITKIFIDGFKSFKDFEMEFTPLTVVAGSNASGKSNLFDALQLLARLAEVDLKTAFGEQRGSAIELFTQYGEDKYADVMKFEVEMLINLSVRDNWGGEADLKYTRLRYELHIQRRSNDRGMENLFVIYESLVNLKHDEDTWVKVHIPRQTREYWRPKVTTGKRGTPYISTDPKNDAITLSQDGKQGGKKTANVAGQTVLSGVNSVDFPHVFATKEEMRSWKFLQLNPVDLREPTRQETNASDIITHTGKNLAAALYRIKQDDEYSLVAMSRTLNSFLPNFTEIAVRDDRANKQFLITLRNEDGIEFSSRVLSEGTLRLLALCVLQYDKEHKSLICFEEPENGIHPCRIETMVHLLKELSVDFREEDTPLRQVIVNTHSPVVVGAMLKWKDDNNVSIWFSQIITAITGIVGSRQKMRISKMLPVPKDSGVQTQLQFTEIENKLTLATIREYLSTVEIENFGSEASL